MSERLFDRIRAIDTDTHITEPPGVWTDRVASKWGDAIPHVKRVEGRDIWFIGDAPTGGPGWTTMAGFNGSFPDSPMGYDDIPKSSYDAKERLAHMDAEGIHGQVLDPNVGGFGSGGFLKLGEPELMLECVRAYNDFLIEWCAADSQRLLPIMATPFWDVAASVKEIERCAATGHRGVLFGSQPDVFGQPHLVDNHWDPVWAAAQAAELPISFHIGSGDVSDLLSGGPGLGLRTGMARASTQLFLENVKCISDVIFGGVCHRFPKLDFVSVESGVSWLLFAIEALDWQWLNNGVSSEHPEYDLLPSEYFRRQIYGCFWFEGEGVKKAIEIFPDNIMYETDFPHPTSMSPGPKSTAEHPRVYADRVLGDRPEDMIRKVVHANAARVYHLD